MDQRSGRGAAPGRGGPADLPAADALDPTPRETAAGPGALPGREAALAPQPDPCGAPEPRRVSSLLVLPPTHHLRRGNSRDAGEGAGRRRVC